jgi:hypothetical protein
MLDDDGLSCLFGGTGLVFHLDLAVDVGLPRRQLGLQKLVRAPSLQKLDGKLVEERRHVPQCNLHEETAKVAAHRYSPFHVVGKIPVPLGIVRIQHLPRRRP